MTDASNHPEGPLPISDDLEAVTGVHLMQGIGHRPAQGFWTEAWLQVIHRPGAIFGLAWLTIVAFFAVFAPFLASGHPIVLRRLVASGEVAETAWPLFEQLRGADVLLALGAIVGLVLIAAPIRSWSRQSRLTFLLVATLHVGITVIVASSLEAFFGRPTASDGMRDIGRASWFPYFAAGLPALVVGGIFALLPFFESAGARIGALALTAAVSIAAIAATWNPPIETFTYRQRVAAGEISAVFTVVPYSPGQGSTALDLKQPLTTPMGAVVDGAVAGAARLQGIGGFRDDPRWQVRRRSDAPALADVTLTDEVAELFESQFSNNRELLPTTRQALLAEFEAARAGELDTLADAVDWLRAYPATPFYLGTDANGQDVMSQMLHACRLSISIGLVSTGIAVMIGVTMGALMGYFGGWVDMLLYRVVEVFMAIPVLFLLIVAAAVLPRNTYVMMIIIGCVTWTGAARFIRAEFYKLRDQDFVQSARSVGLPLRSILFKHMLPNGVTPVLVESSFAIAAAILFEAILSYLGLGPANQPSWGRLLSDATNQVGDFVWWLAIFPGAAIFLTVLSYNLIGEALRDAIDPKLKKARV